MSSSTASSAILFVTDELTVQYQLGGELNGWRVPVGTPLEEACDDLVTAAREVLRNGRPAAIRVSQGQVAHLAPSPAGGLAILLEPDRTRPPQDCTRLLHEARRQVMNSMQAMRAIIRRSAERAGNVQDYALRLEARLDAIGMMLGTLIMSPEATFPLERVIYDALDAQGLPQWEGVSDISGPDVAIDARAAPILALLFHELAANSVEHGVLGLDAGELRIGWTRTDGVLRLHWTELGGRFLPGPPGFGILMMDEVAPYEMGAIVTRTALPGRYEIMMEFPLGRVSPLADAG